MKKFLFFILVCPTLIFSQQKPVPKLVVGIVVDQMRNDYLYRYWNRFGEGGFKRLVNQGYQFRNAQYNYIPTYTGPGHASIYTGATPRQHGIIGNDWFDVEAKTMKGCVKDASVQAVGTINGSGKASPKNLLTSTIGDELKMSSNQKAKVFAVALKDRSAILPAGHAADAAFWMDEATGDFVSSSFYFKQLPEWVKQFNAQKKAKSYLTTGWNTLYPIASYSNSISDDNKYEGHPFSEKPVFPYSFQSYLDKGNYGIIRGTPYGNSLTKDMAIACLKNESLGKDEISDLFCISFSSTDIVAHSYGIRSIEVEDVYLRLDKDLEELLNALDAEVGKDQYIVFLTADHGGADVPAHLMDAKIPAGYLRDKTLKLDLQNFLHSNYGDSSLLLSLSNEQVFLDAKKMTQKKLNADELEAKLSRFLETVPGIAEAYPSQVMKNGSYRTDDIRSLLQAGYHHKLSGNVCYAYQPGWMDYEAVGTTHGAGYSYDTHVPLLFYGFGIPKGESLETVYITQIAPSICELLRINQTNACTSAPLLQLFK
jgi:predicted AlkP superfamily pyrophosphatase or phosphodiesterase